MAPTSRPVRATLTAAPAESTTEQANMGDPGDDSSSVASLGDLDEIMEEFSSDDLPDLVQAGPFTIAQLAAIQDTVRSSLEQALQSFPWSLGHDQQPGTFNTLHRRPGSAAPVDLNRPLKQNLPHKILRGGGRGAGGRDEVWDRETMFSQLAKRSPRVVVSGKLQYVSHSRYF